jgi:hypothetical protein
MRSVFLTLVIIFNVNNAFSGCNNLYKAKIRKSNINAAASTTAIPLLSSSAAAAGYYAPLTSTTTTTGTLGSVPVSTSSSTISNAQVEVFTKAKELINQSKIGFGRRLTTMTDNIRLTLNDFSIEESTIANIIDDGDRNLVFCRSIDELFTFPAIRNYVTKRLR